MSQAIQSPIVSRLFTQGAIERPASDSFSKTCSPRENLTPISVGMRNTWLSFAALAIENKSVLLPNVCLIRIANDS